MRRKNTEIKPSEDKSPHVPQKQKLRHPLEITIQNLTDKQRQFIELAKNKKTKLIFVSGPAGSSKTYLSILVSLILISERRVSDLIYVRSVVESADSKMGYLPGETNDKLAPYMQPLVDKLSEFLNKSQIEVLKKEERITGMPINYLRGLQWNAKAIILDEAQNTTMKELTTFITRIGEFSKVFIIGDPDQSDINGKSGFIKMSSIFDDEESQENGIFVYRFDSEDIVRSKMVKFIVEKLREI